MRTERIFRSKPFNRAATGLAICALGGSAYYAHASPNPAPSSTQEIPSTAVANPETTLQAIGRTLIDLDRCDLPYIDENTVQSVATAGYIPSLGKEVNLSALFTTTEAPDNPTINDFSIEMTAVGTGPDSTTTPYGSMEFTRTDNGEWRATLTNDKNLSLTVGDPAGVVVALSSAQQIVDATAIELSCAQ